MTQRKFKVGDRVVVVSTDEGYQTKFLHLTGVINKVNIQTANVKLSNDENFGFYFFKLEHESVYNSPLYQALL